MKIYLEQIYRKRNEDGEMEEAKKTLELNTNSIACLYKDRNGVFITTKGGKMYKMNHSFKELEPYVKATEESFRPIERI